jgi:hypothetical protein
MEFMRTTIALVLLTTSGCAHLNNQELERTTFKVEKVEKTEGPERTKSITIQILPIQSLTIKAI